APYSACRQPPRSDSKNTLPAMISLRSLLLRGHNRRFFAVECEEDFFQRRLQNRHIDDVVRADGADDRIEIADDAQFHVFAIRIDVANAVDASKLGRRNRRAEPQLDPAELGMRELIDAIDFLKHAA